MTREVYEQNLYQQKRRRHLLSQSPGVKGSILTVCAKGGSGCRSRPTYAATSVEHAQSEKVALPFENLKGPGFVRKWYPSPQRTSLPYHLFPHPDR